jgi:phage/plasmid-associated DNA primase
MLRDCFDSKTSKFVPDFYQEVQAFAYNLHNTTVDYSLISRPFSSSIKSELQAAGKSSVDSFIDGLIKLGVVSSIAVYPPSHSYFKISESMAGKAVPCESLYGCYREWCSRKGRSDIRSETFFRLAIKSVEGVSVKSARMAGKRMDVYIGLPKEVKEVIKLPVSQNDVAEVVEVKEEKTNAGH